MTRRYIALPSVVIPPTRQRREFKLGELNELVSSIQENGLIHAPTLRIEGDNYVLVAGERRLRAIQDIYELGGTFKYDNEEVPPGLLPYVFLGDLSPLEAMEVELEENIRRVDLTWTEKAAATANLMELRQGQAVVRGLPVPTTETISLEVRGSDSGSTREATRRELILAKNLHIPEVASAKTLDEAFKVLKRREATQRNIELAETVGLTFSHAIHEAHNADSLAWMKAYSGPLFDVILTDPPYGMGADDFGDSGGKMEGSHTYSDDEYTALLCYDTLATEGFRITKPDAHLYAFCDLDLFHTLRDIFTLAGWKVFRTPLIWHKPSAYRAPWPHHGPQRKYETILYAIKGDRKVNTLSPDVITCQPDTNLGHAAQKPVALYQDLLARSIQPGDLILDPFCGSGPVFPAAHALRCKAVGIELDPANYGIALGRIKALADEPELEI